MSDFILPEQLMRNIWLGLPIKSTVRFRCVSKSWCTSLSDPEFIYRNLTSFDNAENEKDLLMVLDRDSKLYSVVSHETLAPTPVQLSPLQGVPSADPWHTDVLTFPCDDLVCFHNESGKVIGVWNLTTGETKILPRVSSFRFVTLGFGFDDQIQDYKIVLIGYCHPFNDGDDYQGVDDDDNQGVDDADDDDYQPNNDDHHQGVDGYPAAVYVYSLRSGNNCWRKLEEPYHLDGHLSIPWDGVPWDAYPYCRIHRDGKFYWCESNHLLISFDMSSEVFKIVPIEHPIDDIERFCKLKDGSMLIISVTNSSVEYELWALLEVGVSSSLTKLFHIDWHLGEEMVEPLGFWRNELVFHCLSNGRLLIGDPSSKQKPKEVQIDETLSISKCLAWTKGKHSDV